MAGSNMTACDQCCRMDGRTWVLPQLGRDFIVETECHDSVVKKALPVKAETEIHQYQLLAFADGPNGGTCLEVATDATDPALYAGFALHCFFATDTGGVTYLAKGGFVSAMAVVPDGFVWNAATVAAFSARDLFPEVVYGMEV